MGAEFRTFLLAGSFVFLAAAPVRAAADMAEAVAAVRDDVKQSRRELAGLRDTASRRRVELQKRIAELEHDLAPLRERAARVRDLRWERTGDARPLKRDVDELEEEVRFMAGLLAEFHRDAAARLARAGPEDRRTAWKRWTGGWVTP